MSFYQFTYFYNAQHIKHDARLLFLADGRAFQVHKWMVRESSDSVIWRTPCIIISEVQNIYYLQEWLYNIWNLVSSLSLIVWFLFTDYICITCYSYWIHFCKHFWSWNPQNVWWWKVCKRFASTRRMQKCYLNVTFIECNIFTSYSASHLVLFICFSVASDCPWKDFCLYSGFWDRSSRK